MGADIASACGQLIQQETKSSERDMEDYYKVSSSSLLRSSSAPVSNLPRVTTTNRSSSKSVVAADGREELDATLRVQAEDEHQHSKIIWYLSLATTLAASCFLISSTLYLKQRRR
jgi:hypothetical protein